MAKSDIELRCPKCNSSIFTRADQAGEKVDCPRCQNVMLVPGKKHNPSSDISVDELIDIDDDIMHPQSGGDEIVAQSIDEAVDVSSGPGSLSDDLRLAPESHTRHRNDEPSSDDSSGIQFTGDNTSDPSESDDLGDLLPIPESTPIDDTEDPFEVDENANLNVEGITPHDGQFGIDCHLCGSLLYARVSQVGTKIKCHDCYSMVEVTPPRKKPEPVPVEEPETEDDDGYRLKDPVDLPTIDTTIDMSLGKIDYDDDEFFEKRREMNLHEVDELEEVDDLEEVDEAGEVEEVDDSGVDFVGELDLDDGDDGSDEYGLSPVTSVPKKTPQNYPVFSSPSATAAENDLQPGSVTPSQDSPRLKPEALPEDEAEDKDVAIRVVATGDSSDGENGRDFAGLFSDFGKWLAGAARPLRDVNCLIRLVLVSAALGTCCLVISFGRSYFVEGANQMELFFGFMVTAAGIVPFALTLICFGVMANPIVHVAMHGRGDLSEWPDFSLTDWLGQFVYLGTSFWLAAFPGLIVGLLVFFATGIAEWLLATVVFSSLMLAPVFLASVVYHESPGSLISTSVFRSIVALKNRWLRFWMAALLIVLLVLIGFFVSQFGLAGYPASVLLIASLFVYYWILGELTGQVVRWVTEDAEKTELRSPAS